LPETGIFSGFFQTFCACFPVEFPIHPPDPEKDSPYVYSLFNQWVLFFLFGASWL